MKWLHYLSFIELHVHADGGVLNRELAVELAERNNIILSPKLGTSGPWSIQNEYSRKQQPKKN